MMQDTIARDSRRRRASARRGISSMWTILWLPVFLLAFCILLNISGLWLARVELENALEAAALAAVKEWGDADGGPTAGPRAVGVQTAALNYVRGVSVLIDDNLGAADINENDQYTITKGDPSVPTPPAGNLIFGAIDDSDPQFPVTFDATQQPSCGVATVLLDATGQGNLAADNAWGIAFHPTPDTPPGLRITEVVITLPGGGMFDFTQAGPTLSDNVAPHKVNDNSSNSQPDIQGFSDPGAQISFSPTVGMSPTLTITFSADPGMGGDDGFAPTDRLRFGARVANVSSGSGADDGDGIGRDGATVSVTFSDLSVQTGTFLDNTESSNACIDPALTSSWGSLIVHPTGIPDLPCPESSAGGNNGQSYALLSGGNFRPFAVRAQATVIVTPTAFGLFNIPLAEYCVTAKATAMYDCQSHRPRLIRVDRFLPAPP